MSEQELKEIICRLFLNSDLDFPLEANTKLLDEGICDSLGLIQLALELENHQPGIQIQDQEITRDHFGTMAAILKFLENKGQLR